MTVKLKAGKKVKAKGSGKPGNLSVRFVDEYLKDRNASQAAIRCGYRPKGAGVQGCRLLKNPKIAAEIAQRTADISAKAGITAERVMQEYARLAFLDPIDLVNPDGSMKSMSEMPEDARRAIAGLEISERTDLELGGMIGTKLKKIKLNDKKGTLDSIAKILGMMKEQVEHSGTITLAQLLGGE